MATYTCILCHKKFTTKQAMYNHLKSVHNEHLQHKLAKFLGWDK